MVLAKRGRTMSDEPLFIGYDHVAYATRDTDATVKVLEQLGFSLKIYKEELKRFNVYVTKLVSGDAAQNVAEVVEPISAPSAVSNLVGDRDSMLYHACFRTNDLRRAQERLKHIGAVVVTKPMRIPYPVTEKHKSFMTSHMYHPSLGLFEITGPLLEPHGEYGGQN
jgi:aminocarboxycyclopropane-forming enzyme